MRGLIGSSVDIICGSCKEIHCGGCLVQGGMRGVSSAAMECVLCVSTSYYGAAAGLPWRCYCTLTSAMGGVTAHSLVQWEAYCTLTSAMGGVTAHSLVQWERWP